MKIKKLFVLGLFSITSLLSANNLIMLKPNGSIFAEENGKIVQIDTVAAGTKFETPDSKDTNKDVWSDENVEKDVKLISVEYEGRNVFVKSSETCFFGAAFLPIILKVPAAVYRNEKLRSVENRCLPAGTLVLMDCTEFELLESERGAIQLSGIVYWNSESGKKESCHVLTRKLASDIDSNSE